MMGVCHPGLAPGTAAGIAPLVVGLALAGGTIETPAATATGTSEATSPHQPMSMSVTVSP